MEIYIVVCHFDSVDFNMPISRNVLAFKDRYEARVFVDKANQFLIEHGGHSSQMVTPEAETWFMENEPDWDKSLYVNYNGCSYDIEAITLN